MFRFCCIFLFFTLLGSKTFNAADVELDVVFSDSTVHCRYLYVISLGDNGLRDTIARFDSLSFNRHDRVSLFYPVNNYAKNMIAFADSQGVHTESEPFRISLLTRSAPAIFRVSIGNQQVTVAKRDYFHLQKDENLAFVFVMFATKVLIMLFLVMLSALPKRTIAISTGAFFASSLLNWFFPLHYLYSTLISLPAEYLLIALIGRKYISWLRAAILVLVVNIAGFGIIAFLYIVYMFW